MGHGQWLGAPSDRYQNPDLTPKQVAWVNQAIREVMVPPGLMPIGFGCNSFKLDVTANCLASFPPSPQEWQPRLIGVGTYQPFLYLVPGVFARLGHDKVSGLVWGRIGSALLALGLLVAGVICFVESAPHAIGVMLALTPMCFHIAAVLNPSGGEIASAFAFTCALLSVTRDSPSSRMRSRVRIPVVLVSGIVLALSRSLGPVWVAAIAMICGARFAMEYQRWPWSRIATLGIPILFACGLNRVWESLYGPSLSIPRGESVFQSLVASLRDLPHWLKQVIGVFQWLDTMMPNYAYAIWSLAWGGLFVGAWRAAHGRARLADRIVLILVATCAILSPVFLQGIVLRPFGWAVQGRHVLPLVLTLPLLAAEIYSRDWRISRTNRMAISLAALGCGYVHLVALYSNARRSSVGANGPLWFFAHAQWEPWGGWWLWTAIGLAGVAALISAVIHEPAVKRDWASGS